MASSEDRWSFIAQWYDVNAPMHRMYTLIYYPASKELEMIDNKLRRPFLRRTKLEGINNSMFYVGAAINILGRQLDLTDYADIYTRQTLSNKQERTCVFVMEEALANTGLMLGDLNKAGLSITRGQMIHLDGGASRAINQHGLSAVHAGNTVVLEMVGSNAIQQALKACGSVAGTAAAPTSTSAHAILTALTDARLPLCSRLKGTTLCLIKPHAVAAGLTGQILEDVFKAGYVMTGFRTQTLDRTHACEFLEVYKGVVPEYNAMVAELESGLSVAVEVTKPGTTPNADFRSFVGPAESEVARHLRPQTLRAKYGVDKIQNAVHCTDLVDDQALEVEYFFSLLTNTVA